MSKKYLKIIGIDPAVNTGFAVWSPTEKKLVHVSSMPIHKGVEYFMHMLPEVKASTLVRVEDARLRRWFGSSGPERWKGAGSIMRDCKIWEDFLTEIGIDVSLVPPKNNRTKLKADAFKALTGYDAKTNEHGRDAAMLVFGL